MILNRSFGGNIFIYTLLVVDVVVPEFITMKRRLVYGFGDFRVLKEF